MADDAAGAVRRTPRPAPAIPELWWSPTIGVWRRTPRGPMLTPGFEMANDPIGGNFRESLPADAVQLVGPDQRRPVVLLRADDCDCGPPYADCLHGPEPVDALDLAVWLHAESEHHRAWLLKAAELELASHGRAEDKLAAELEDIRQHARNVAAQRDVEHRAYLGAAARVDAALAIVGETLPSLDLGDGAAGADGLERVRAALQGDQPTEPDERLAGMARPAEGVQLIADAFGIAPGEAAAQLRDAIRAAAWSDLDEPGQPTGEADRGA